MALNLNTVLNGFYDTVFLITDDKGNVIFPEDVDLVQYVSDLVMVQKDKYVNPNNNSWYKLDEISIDGGKYKVKRFTDISEHVFRESLYDIDPVTGILIRRKFLEEFKNYLLRNTIKKEPFSICMGDLDKFKGVNDTYGHLAGDEVLKTVAQTIKKNIIQSGIGAVESNKEVFSRDYRRNIIGRYGGEEFLTLIKGINSGDSSVKFEAIRNNVATNPIIYKYPNDGIIVNIPITISFGVVNVSPDFFETLGVSEENVDALVRELVQEADNNLYLAKKTRNTCVFTSK